MPYRVSAYGFLGRGPRDLRSFRYQMPSSVASPLRSFRLYALVLWPAEEGGRQVTGDRSQPGSGSGPRAPSPEPRASSGLLLSLKVQSKDGPWKEQLDSPRPLTDFAAPFDIEGALACVPMTLPPLSTRFAVFSGETPLAGAALVNSPEVARRFESFPAGPVSVKWSGELRGLLLLGTAAK